MKKKLAQSLLLMAVVASMMIGGGLVQEGRREMWVDVNSGVSVAANEPGVTGESADTLQQIADVISDGVFIKSSDCPMAHKSY